MLVVGLAGGADGGAGAGAAGAVGVEADGDRVSRDAVANHPTVALGGGDTAADGRRGLLEALVQRVPSIDRRQYIH